MSVTDVPPSLPRRLAELGEAEGEFIRRLTLLDRGQLAILRRNAGNPIGESRGCSWFYALLPPALRGREWDEERCFLVATLFAADRDEARRRASAQLEGISFGAIARTFVEARQSDSLRRRFGILLDCPADTAELAFRLRQWVRLMLNDSQNAPRRGIAWLQLLTDLREWSRPGKHVQKQWARDFFVGPAAADADEDQALSSN